MADGASSLDLSALAGSDAYLDRIEVLVAEMLKDDGVRLPGTRREALRRRAEAEGWRRPLRCSPPVAGEARPLRSPLWSPVA